MDDVVCVHLYGDGRRDCRLRAEYIHCQQASECSAFRNGECFCVTTLFGTKCGIGQVQIIDGGTKQSKAFRTVSGNAKAHPKYAALRYPQFRYITRIGDQAFLSISYIDMELRENGDLVMKDGGFGMNRILVPSNVLTPDNIARICKDKPRTLMGGVIRDHADKVVPYFLKQMKEVFPEKYQSFIDKYPEYADVAPNYVGRRAKLITCNRNETYRDTHGEFRFDGDYLVCDSYRSAFAPFCAKECKLRLRVTDDMLVNITSNAQVLPDTVFV